MKKKKKNETTIASEPQVGYGKDIVFFKSFEEMNEYDDRTAFELPYQERLEHLNYMLKNFYRDEITLNPTLGKKIYFD
jgi:hypothetical protein